MASRDVLEVFKKPLAVASGFLYPTLMTIGAHHFWAAVGGLFLGIAFADLYALSYFFALAAIVVSGALFLLPKSRYGTLLALFFFATAFGVLRVDMATYFSQSNLDAYVGGRVTLVGKIVDEPDKRDATVRLTTLPYTIVTISGEEVAIEGSARVLVSAPLPASFSYGDMVRVEGVLERPKKFDTKNGREFDYPEYLAARGIYYQVPFPKVALSERGGVSVRGTLFAVKQMYLAGLQNALPEPYSSLAGGITVGDKRSLGEKLSEQFRRTGLVHIVVLSGYNITLIVTALMLLVRSAKLRTRFIFGGGVIIAFVLMTGASATGVRAGAMAILALLAAASYRKYAISRALALTAAGMVLWNPHTLLYDPGFQLSVVATLGLVHLSPVIVARLEWITERLQMREIFAATLGTQAAVLPLLLYQTGLLSLVSLFANLLVLPVIPAAMIASFVSGFGGIIYDTIGIAFGIPAYILLAYAVWMTEFLSKLPFGAIEISAFSGWWVVGVYALVITTPWLWQNVVQRRSNLDF